MPFYLNDFYELGATKEEAAERLTDQERRDVVADYLMKAHTHEEVVEYIVAWEFTGIMELTLEALDDIQYHDWHDNPVEYAGVIWKGLGNPYVTSKSPKAKGSSKSSNRKAPAKRTPAKKKAPAKKSPRRY